MSDFDFGISFFLFLCVGIVHEGEVSVPEERNKVGPEHLIPVRNKVEVHGGSRDPNLPVCH